MGFIFKNGCVIVNIVSTIGHFINGDKNYWILCFYKFQFLSQRGIMLQNYASVFLLTPNYIRLVLSLNTSCFNTTSRKEFFEIFGVVARQLLEAKIRRPVVEQLQQQEQLQRHNTAERSMADSRREVIPAWEYRVFQKLRREWLLFRLILYHFQML